MRALTLSKADKKKSAFHYEKVTGISIFSDWILWHKQFENNMFILPSYNITEFQEKYRAFKQEDYTYCRGQEEFDVGYKASLTKFQLICHVPEM